MLSPGKTSSRRTRAWALLLLCLLGMALPLRAGDETLASPRGTFTIAQHFDGEVWTSKLHFGKGGRADIMLTNEYPWPADFEVSPDDKWILRIQKSGSGDNVSFLYQMDAAGRLWRMQESFHQAAFAFLASSLKVTEKELYHTGIEFDSWDMRRGLLRFTIRGSLVALVGKGEGGGISQSLAYDMANHRFHMDSSKK